MDQCNHLYVVMYIWSYFSFFYFVCYKILLSILSLSGCLVVTYFFCFLIFLSSILACKIKKKLNTKLVDQHVYNWLYTCFFQWFWFSWISFSFVSIFLILWRFFFRKLWYQKLWPQPFQVKCASILVRKIYAKIWESWVHLNYDH